MGARVPEPQALTQEADSLHTPVFGQTVSDKVTLCQLVGGLQVSLHHLLWLILGHEFNFYRKGLMSYGLRPISPTPSFICSKMISKDHRVLISKQQK